MNLIDNYASEVGRRLPRKDRADIEAEIRSALQDLLDERSRSMGKPIDNEMTFEVLKEYGDPEKVAASYHGERYLIGPRLYPFFIKVLRVFFPAIAILAGFWAMVNVSRQVAPIENISGTFVSVLIGVVTTVISALGNLVLIFAIIEWMMRNEGFTSKGNVQPTRREWDPRSLTRISPPNQIKLSDLITEIVACFAAIVIFNFYPQMFSLGFTSGGQWYLGIGNWTFIPLLSQAFFHYIPYLTAVWVLTIILDIILLRMGFWNTTTRIVSIGLKVIGILIATSLLVEPSLIGVSASSFAAVGLVASSDTIGVMIFSLNQLVRLILLLIIFLSGLDIIKAIIRIHRPSFPGAPQGK